MNGSSSSWVPNTQPTKATLEGREAGLGAFSPFNSAVRLEPAPLWSGDQELPEGPPGICLTWGGEGWGEVGRRGGRGELAEPRSSVAKL